jgi:two-component system chemotaxis response regulator CheB
VVQHMPPGFVRSLARELDVLSSIAVGVADHETPVRAGEVWFAPAGRHIELRRRPDRGLETALRVGHPVHGCMPAIDPLARSAAAVLRERSALIVLTGMGRDGLDGARHIRRAGGVVIAQDAGSSRVYGMPRAVVEGDLAHAVLSPESIATFMCDITGRRSCV